MKQCLTGERTERPEMS